jgi:hypothetical protein
MSAAGPPQGTRPLGGTARSDARGEHPVRLARLALLAMMLAAPAGAQTPRMAPTVAAPVSKECEAAKRRVDREQKALTTTADGIARDQHARASCTSRSVCARFDEAISDAQRRMVRREARLARFRDEASASCG